MAVAGFAGNAGGRDHSARPPRARAAGASLAARSARQHGPPASTASSCTSCGQAGPQPTCAECCCFAAIHERPLDTTTPCRCARARDRNVLEPGAEETHGDLSEALDLGHGSDTDSHVEQLR